MVLPQPDRYMGSLEGKHGQHDLPWSCWVNFYAGLSSTQVMAEPGETVLEISSAGGRAANTSKAQLYQRCPGRGSAPLNQGVLTREIIPMHGEGKGCTPDRDERPGTVWCPGLFHRCSCAELHEVAKGCKADEPHPALVAAAWPTQASSRVEHCAGGQRWRWKSVLPTGH